MQYLAFLLNLPWTAVGLLASVLSVPYKARISLKPLAIILHVKSFWWYAWLPGMAKVRAMVNGHLIQMGPRADEADLCHELIHVEQYIRQPLIHPFLYAAEKRKKGYRRNKYEEEAYVRSKSRYEAD